MDPHAHTPTARTQAQIILEMLQARPGLWVGMLELGAAAHAAAVHSRISQLRGEGHNIEQVSKWGKVTDSETGEMRRVCMSFYKLLPAPAPLPSTAIPTADEAGAAPLLQSASTAHETAPAPVHQ